MPASDLRAITTPTCEQGLATEGAAAREAAALRRREAPHLGEQRWQDNREGGRRVEGVSEPEGGP